MKFSAVTLHVGLGTFRPIASESLDEHRMHREWGELSATAAGEFNASRQAGERLIAVGTTVTRVLETAVRAAGASARRISCPGKARRISSFARRSSFKRSTRLLTNFHFPRTTLLVLVETSPAAS